MAAGTGLRGPGPAARAGEICPTGVNIRPNVAFSPYIEGVKRAV